MVSCHTPMNNLTYCGLNPIEKVGDFLTTSNYGLPQNWIFLAFGIGMILLWGFIVMRVQDKKLMIRNSEQRSKK